jgi:hypothetical protein
VLQPILVNETSRRLRAGRRRAPPARGQMAGLERIPGRRAQRRRARAARPGTGREPPAHRPLAARGGARLPPDDGRVRPDAGGGRGARRALALGGGQHAAPARPCRAGPGGDRRWLDQRGPRPSDCRPGRPTPPRASRSSRASRPSAGGRACTSARPTPRPAPPRLGGRRQLDRRGDGRPRHRIELTIHADGRVRTATTAAASRSASTSRPARRARGGHDRAPRRRQVRRRRLQGLGRPARRRRQRRQRAVGVAARRGARDGKRLAQEYERGKPTTPVKERRAGEANGPDPAR